MCEFELSAAVANGRATNLATHPPNLATHPPDLAIHHPNLAAYPPDLATHPPDLATHPHDLASHPYLYCGHRGGKVNRRKAKITVCSSSVISIFKLTSAFPI